MNKSLLSLIIILPLAIIIVTQLSSLFPSLEPHVDYIIGRFNMLRELSYDKSRLAEAWQDIGLFIKSPVYGHGYGILNQFAVEGWGTPLFGHNFLTSLLSRTGVLGISIIVWYGLVLFKRMSFSKESVIARGALSGAIVLLFVSNFSGFQMFGIYGAIAGIACGEYIGRNYEHAVSLEQKGYIKAQ